MQNTRPGPAYEAEPREKPLEDTSTSLRLIAYYLPQFHPIALNDAAWGKGFTEWTNVTRGLPRYVGQCQPRLPSALGFYDLRQVDVMREQAALARRFGIHGFCFHYYWFSGEQVLQTPLANLLRTPDLDLPFCINWANESWTRTWDGAERDVIIRQRYGPEDPKNFADAITPILLDPRYIRVQGKPLLMFYRPGAAPEAAEMVNIWRERLRANGVGDCYLAMAQAFDDYDPRPYGLDGACGFPPHNVGYSTLTINRRMTILDEDFSGEIHDYNDMVRAALDHQPTDYEYFPAVCPSWDNEARKPGRGLSFHGSTPAAYEEWLYKTARNVQVGRPPQKQIVFINAWNEWAEGAYLEPDQHYGYAYLGATARALRRAADIPLERSISSPSADTGPNRSATAIERARFGAARLLDQIAARLRP